MYSCLLLQPFVSGVEVGVEVDGGNYDWNKLATYQLAALCPSLDLNLVLVRGKAAIVLPTVVVKPEVFE